MRTICAAGPTSMNVPDARRLKLEGLIEVTPRRFPDDRGFFSEVWHETGFARAGIRDCFVQDNFSYSALRGTVRGLHFQVPPIAQAKLVRVSRGAIFDVAVDVRSASATFGQWEGVVLSADKWNQLYVPQGFAHGFMTLEDDTEVNYKVSAPYSPEHERSIRFDDPAIGIEWPIGGQRLLSQKDAAAPMLADLETSF